MMPRFPAIALLTLLFFVPAMASAAADSAALDAFRARDYGTALVKFKPAAAAGDADAQYYLGVMLQQGWGVIADTDAAVRWFESAARQGHMKAQHNLAQLLQRGIRGERDPAQAIEWYRRAANQGSAKSAQQLGLAYYRGDGVERDYALALRWWREAYANGVADAGYNLGVMYRRGLGVTRDGQAAFTLWQEAGRARSPAAQNAVGSAYLNGDVGIYDPVLAYAWFRLAAEAGVAIANSNAELALMRLDDAQRDAAYDQADALKQSLTAPRM